MIGHVAVAVLLAALGAVKAVRLVVDAIDDAVTLPAGGL